MFFIRFRFQVFPQQLVSLNKLFLNLASDLNLLQAIIADFPGPESAILNLEDFSLENTQEM